MTIVAGFAGKGVYGGMGQFPERRFIVIAADSEASGDVMKSAVPKIAVIDNRECKCLIGGSGPGDFIEFAIQEIHRNLAPPYTLNGVRELIGQTVTDIHHTRIFPIPQKPGQYDFNLLCAVWVEREGIQLINVGCGFANIETRPASIGWGGAFASYLSDSYYVPTLNLYQVTHLAAYMIHLVKRYVMYCGGDTRVMWIDDQGTVVELPPSEIQEHEKAASLVMDSGAKWLLHLVEPMGYGWDMAKVHAVIDGLPKFLKAVMKQAYPNLKRRRPPKALPATAPVDEGSKKP